MNGSPRPAGNTRKLIGAFTEGAESQGHEVTVVDVCKKNVKRIFMVVWAVSIVT
ncbi:MAG: NAD(P)H-dependent oxidoreductase [Clostridiales bacterium]|nr:NAD(P)H-dependent oxidoreductase [Clostridiales bacterium]